MESKDVEDFSCQEDERQRYEVSGEQKHPAASWTAKKKAEKWDAEIAMKNCKANGLAGEADE
jgi:hypothetical protein